ncbi:MAG: type II toxin-antitoxin system prevent-host-death family antitoxin [SAR324 cluster bacterium]|nr:type II toxin-antitoxin system prevent-host-death family antitoxin [SAR324 cluster bacterium]
MSHIHVGIYEAKTQLSKLIESVNNGTEITITQRGRPVALLVPYKDDQQIASSRKMAVKNIRNFRKQQKPVEDFEHILKADRK